MDERTGMTQFLGPKHWSKVSCVMKRLYSDFIVIEIPLNGEVLKPAFYRDDDNGNKNDDDDEKNDNEMNEDNKNDKGEMADYRQKRNANEKVDDEPEEKRPKGESNDDKNEDETASKQQGNNDDNVAANAEVEEEENRMQFDESEPLPEVLTEADVTAVDEVCRSVRECYKLVVSSFNKEQRRNVYSYLRRRFRNEIIINSGNGVAEVYRWDNQANIDPRDARAKQNQKKLLVGDNYYPDGHNLYFTMTKVNKDTSAAISAIVNLYKKEVDKRKSSSWKQTRVYVAGQKDRRAITTQQVCIPSKSIRSIKTKAAWLRNIGIYVSDFRYSPEKLKLGDLWGNHFDIALRDVDVEALGGEEALAERIKHWTTHGFLNYFGGQRFGACGVNTADVGRLMLTGQWKEAVDMIMAPRKISYEGFYQLAITGWIGDVLKAYEDADGDGKKTLNLLNLKEQEDGSHWKKGVNVEERIVWALSGNGNNHKDALGQLSRDSRSLYVHAYQSLIFNHIISRRYAKYGTTPIAGDLGADGQPLPVDAESVDIHYPLPTANEPPAAQQKLPNNDVAEWYEELANKNGVHEEEFNNLQSLAIVGNAFRPMIAKPKNVTWELVEYTDPRVTLQTSPFVPDSINNFAPAVDNQMDIDRVVSGESTDDNQPPPIVSDHCNQPPPAVNESGDNQQPSPPSPSPDKSKALLISFDLPASSYATVALRELLRFDFSKEAQKRLEGVCAYVSPEKVAHMDSGEEGGYESMTDMEDNPKSADKNSSSTSSSSSAEKPNRKRSGHSGDADDEGTPV